MWDFQEESYERLKKEKKNITLFLKSGVRIPGQIVGVDRFTVLMLVNENMAHPIRLQIV
ncbi:RNA chaperone Hfq, partial [Bacillus mycoides]